MKFQKGAEYFFCILIAVPTSILNGFAAAINDAQKVSNLTDIGSFVSILKETSSEKLAYGAVVCLTSNAVLFWLNKLYFLDAMRQSLSLLRRGLPQSKRQVAEISLFIWTAGTSLIFGELGVKSLSFLGTTGKVIGFFLNYIVYFSTRFASARLYFFRSSASDDLSDLGVSPGPHTPLMNRPATLNEGAAQRDYYPWIKKMGFVLALFSLIPVMTAFSPEAVQGMESLFQVDIGENAKYQNAGSIILGYVFTALTALFYAKSINVLPGHLLKTARTTIHHSEHIYLSCAKIVGFFLVLGFASYFTSVGFGLTAKMDVDNGNLDYLGAFKNAIPAILVSVVTGMLWSHLQDLLNQKITAFEVSAANERTTSLASITTG